MRCELCGTKVKVVGNTTKHYEPVLDFNREAAIQKMVEVLEAYGNNEATIFQNHWAKEALEAWRKVNE